MRRGDLSQVARIEARIFPFPWTYGNFADSIAAGYDSWVFERAEPPVEMLGYAIVMWLPDEVHLLNLSVDAPVQGQGLGAEMLDWLMADAGTRGARSMLLEVRPSNTAALRLYERKGFLRVGLRRRYYPSFEGAREDAIVMVRRLRDETVDG
ncbi:MAG: ribosomal-protein-alanine N-acetyltransferase [Pseudomonadota bacterium]